MKRTSMEQLEQWHVQGQYQKIVEAIEAIDPTERGYELTGQLARAYNNLGQYERALTLLLATKNEGQADPNWHFRVGYAYYYSNQRAKAAAYFAHVLDLQPDDADAREYLVLCQLDTNQKPIQTLANKTIGKHSFDQHANRRHRLPPIRYPAPDLTAVRTHIEQYFGPITKVIPCPSARDLHVDLCLCAPTPERDYWQITTLGMGACPMNLPPEQLHRSPERLELTITLPRDWNVDSMDEIWFWPQRWLWILSRLPFQDNGWLGFGHSLATDGYEPFAANTQQSGLLLLGPQDAPTGATVCTLADGQKVGFLQLIPLYREEMEFKLAHGVHALVERMADIDHVFCPYRLNTCAPDIERPRNPYLLS